MTEKPQTDKQQPADKAGAEKPATNETGGIAFAAKPSAHPHAPASAAPQTAPSGPQSAQQPAGSPEAPARANAAPAQAGRDSGPALRHPSQVRVSTTRGDLTAKPTQINHFTISIPWNPDASRGEDNEVNVPPDAQRTLRTGLSFHVAAGYEAIVTCAGGETGHRIPVAHLQGRAKDELIIRFRNSGAQNRTFLAGQELAQLTLRKLEALDMAFSDPHADKADDESE